jgi:hypothetical protein
MIKPQNILIISPFFFPEPISTGKFNSDIAIALRDKGNKVAVLCSHPIYPKWKVEKSNLEIEGIKIKRGGGSVYYPKKPVFRRMILEIWFACYVFRNISRFKKKLDIIIPVFPPSLAFYAILPFIKSKIIKVGMIHDLQEVYSSDKKGFVNKIVKYCINKVEGKAFKSCDKLIFLSEEMKITAKDFYKISENKIFVQYPFANINTSNLTDDLGNILPENKNHIVYSGALGEKQNPQGIYDFYDYASKRLNNSVFHFFSQGQIFESLKANNKNPRIKFHSLVPRTNVEELYKRSSVQIIPQLPNTSKGSLPSKLPNLLASGCKILFITDPNSEIHKLFQKYNLERVVTSWENEILFQSLSELLEKREFDAENQKRVSEELFSMDSMVNKIL